ncbi:MAG: DUF99 family protein [archaeon]
MKKEVCVLGIDDSSFNRETQKSTIIIGAYYRGGEFLDGILTSIITIDGTDSTEKMIIMINSSKFRHTLSCMFLDGITFAGFNIVDIEKLYKKTKIPVIVVIRKKPDLGSIESALTKIGMKRKIALLKKAGKIYHTKNIYFQKKGISKDNAIRIIDATSTHSKLPEPLRVAHLIGQGLFFGESKGKA